MAMLDVFKTNEAFSSMELTSAINVVPNNYGRLQQLNIFPPQPVRTTVVALERKFGLLNLLPTVTRGGPATKGAVGKRDLMQIGIPQIPHEDRVPADDVQNIRAFGSESELMGVMDLVNDKLITMTSKHFITLEYLRWGALKGQVLDADGTTVLLDLFTLFGVTQTVIDFVLSTQTEKIDKTVFALKRHFEQNAFGQVYTGIHAMCSPGFFEDLYTHDDVRKSFNRNQGPSNQFGEDYRNAFPYNGIIWEEHSGQAVDVDGNVRKFIPDDEAIAFPTGAPMLFATHFAPADFMEAVNTLGQQIYVKQEVEKYDRGVEMHTQSNPIPVCRRPQLLVRLTKS